MSIVERPTLASPEMAPALTGPVPPLATRAPRKWPRRVMLGVIVAAAGFSIAAKGYRWFVTPAVATNAVLTYTAVPETFDVKIPLTGELRAVKNVEIRSQVEQNTTIIWIVPEGTQVDTGELLVKLASDQIKDRLEDIKIRVENDRAAVVNAEQLLSIQEKQNATDISTAETNADLADRDWKQFADEKNGDARIELDTRETAATNAQADRDRKAEDLKRAKDLFGKKFVSSNDVLDAEIALRDAENKLKTANANLVLWNAYVRPKQEITLKKKMLETKALLERTTAVAQSNMTNRESDLRAKKGTLRISEDRLEMLEKQLQACEIRAPRPGMVVYQSSVGWNNSGPIEEGASVRLNQTLIQLPDTSHMQVEVRLAEQMIERVKRDQEAVITIDALPGRVFHGRVSTIATLPDAGARWNNSNNKEYITIIPLDEAIDQKRMQVKPGMTAKAEILLKRLEDVVAVPTQAIFSSGGKPYVYVGSPTEWKKVDVSMGAASQSKTEILKGIALGDTVLLSRPANAVDDSGAGAGEKRRGKRGAATSPAKVEPVKIEPPTTMPVPPAGPPGPSERAQRVGKSSAS